MRYVLCAREVNKVSLRACFRAVALVARLRIVCGAADAATRDLVPLATTLVWRARLLGSAHSAVRGCVCRRNLL
jgi:hypothetical protein